MTLYRFSSILLVLSVTCMALSALMGNTYHLLLATICVVLSGQLYASGVREEQAKGGRSRR